MSRCFFKEVEIKWVNRPVLCYARSEDMSCLILLSTQEQLLRKEINMSTLELSLNEHQLLQDVLESALSDLRVEIVSTDRIDFKEALKKRKQLMMDMLEKLQQINMVALHSAHE